MRVLCLLVLLALAGCTEATSPSPDFARQKYPPGVIPCVPEDGCVIIPNP